MRKYWFLCLIFGWQWLQAQTNIGLVAYYPFEDLLTDVTGNTANTGFSSGNPGFACSIAGQALSLDGAEDQIAFMGPVTTEFDTEDFSVSLYFKSTGIGGTQVLLAKQRVDCATENSFFIRYVPLNRSLSVSLEENPSQKAVIIQRLPADVCWQHITVVRKGGNLKLYVNGRFSAEVQSSKRANILNDGDLILGGSDCLTGSEQSFRGFIDEFRVYNRALDPEEIAELYASPEKIITQDTIIFLGNAVDISISNTCTNQFDWMPREGVAQVAAAETSIRPVRPGDITYQLSFIDNASGCIATDSIRLSVIDPADLDCNTVFIPNAFTPNGEGPFKNEKFGISNPFAIQELISFEIFDRWGNRVFATADPFERWDGNYKGQAVNPGVMLYKIQYRCNGELRSDAGSLTILR